MTFRLGRIRPRAPRQHLRMRGLIGDALPPPPPTCDWSGPALPCLSQVLLNDRLGCCTASGAFHVAGVLVGNAIGSLKFADAQVEAFYAATTGYKPGDAATDQGGDEGTVLDYWRAHGLYDGKHRILGSITVDPTNLVEMKTALWLFENLYFGCELPDAWINPEPETDGFIWDASGEPNPDNGHCFMAFGYDTKGMLDVDSWGLRGKMTAAAAAKYAVRSASGELHCILSTDSIIRATQKAANGFDFAKLISIFNAMGGDVAALAYLT